MAGLPCVLHADGVDHACMAHNLSRSGVLLAGHLPRDVAGTVETTLRSAAGDLVVRLPGRVARVLVDDDGDVSLALELGALDEAQKKTLDDLVSRVVEGVFPAILDTLTPESPLPELREALGLIPLAHRITVASRAQPKERELLFRDSHPLVLEALARNPTTTLPEIRALLRVPELVPTTLAMIAADTRWKKDDDLMIQVATHPRVTLKIADEVVSRMSEMAKTKVLRKPGLHPAVKAKIVPKPGSSRVKSW